ncbi:unnamed protein product [Cuscuta campestris]|uniref:F-box domain-containing protein n=1 Tax=Cuscuta campestris TaxID=132261 RepID=A0A484M1D3_9ASTE|nr:unnamed protein product [Cuscuta campestris]
MVDRDPPRRGKASIGQLPDDILIDILSRLPVDTVLRCRTVIQNLTSAPLSPPNLALVVTVQNTESHENELKDDSSAESHVGDVMDNRPKLMNEEDERSNAVENNEGDISKDIVNVDTDPVHASTYVFVAELALLEGANKVADADNKHADNPFSFDTIKLFDNVDAVKTKHLVSPREPTLGIGSIPHVPRFDLRSKMIEDLKSGLLPWFNTLSLDPPRRGKASIGQLPDDILIDILSRLPADTVLRCRTVCQDWRSLTLSHYFTGLQAERAPSAVIVQGIQLGLHKKSDDYYIYDAVSKKLRQIPFNLNIYKGFYFPSVRGACGGPFLHLKSYATLWKDGTNIFSSHPIKCDFVFNIITQQLLGVRSELQDFVCGVYFHKATNECNYLCVRRVSAEERCFQYFSYNIVSRTTKKIACSRFSCRQDANNYPVALNGALHMMTCDDCMHAVLVFEIDSRKLYALPHPEVECVDGQVDGHKLMTLFVHDGHLGMCHARDLGVGRFDIWILEDYAKWRWVRKARFTLRKPRFGLDTMRDMLAGGCFMVSSIGKDELFIGWFSRLLLVVNVKEQSIKEIKVPHKLKSANIRRCAAYTSSLVTHHGWLG